MEREVRLFDYKDNEKKFIIQDFENVEELVFEILSGDNVLTVVYPNKEIELDSGENRLIDFHDGIWILRPQDLDLINRMKNHSDTTEFDEAEL